MNRRERRPERGRRSQSCFELRGNQYLHASISTLSLPPSLSQTSSQTSDSLYRTSCPLPTTHRPYKPNRASHLRVRSAPAVHAEPDYGHMARRRRESILLENTLTAKPTLKAEVPEGETLHSFLIGGRYNSAHHIDTRSLQRFGVYVPRNTSVKTFINSAGTAPPSPAVFGLHPLRKHLPMVVKSSPPQTTDRGLLLVKQDLVMQFSEDARQSKTSSLNISTISEDPGHTKTAAAEDVDTTPTEGDGVMNLCKTQGPVAEREIEDDGVASDEASSVVSASNLLSPEAQLLTHEILLETGSVSGKRDTSNKPDNTTGARKSSRNKDLSRAYDTPRQRRSVSVGIVRPCSATLPRGAEHCKPATRPKSAFQVSNTRDTHTLQSSSQIFVDLSKLKF